MSEKRSVRLVLPLDEPAAGLEIVGGKGASLARLAAAGMPVPTGFHVTIEAYRDFVTHHGLQEQVLAAVSTSSPENAAERIGQVFAEHPVPEPTAVAIRKAYAELGDDVAVAVRSSATAEDLPDASFAGQQDTFLDVRGQTDVLNAVKRCWASLWTARAIEYRARHGIAPEDVALAVVVQRLVPADAAGVLFTADPVTGDAGPIVINAAPGLGEELVSGTVDPHVIVVDRSGQLAERRGEPLIEPAQVSELVDLANGIEQLYLRPMDIEWAVHGGRVYILQARPITTQTYEQWNDSLAGDFLWTNGNLSEGAPDVMTPCTWSVNQLIMGGTFPISIDGVFLLGNIGGRLYANVSVVATIAWAFGVSRQRSAAGAEELFGRLPEGRDIPLLPVTRGRVLRAVLPAAAGLVRKALLNSRHVYRFWGDAPQRCEALLSWIRQASSPGELAEVWQADLGPFCQHACDMLAAGAVTSGGQLTRTRQRLSSLVGDQDADALLSGLDAGDGQLASLGPIMGLAQLSRGEIDRQTYIEQHGHRGPHEVEISLPRPAEDPGWIDRQLEQLPQAEHAVDALLAQQRTARDAAWERLQARYPKRVASLRRQIDQWAVAARGRELARSETVRIFSVLRAFVLQAGAVTGHGQRLFFLSINEILALLRGNDTVLQPVDRRKATYELYSSLPPYPSLIRGQFDPVRWAGDPNRRSDLFDARGTEPATRQTVTGFPGAAGTIDGPVRVLAKPEDGDQLESGEVLVTAVTNIGWTPIFPRAAAVVTDVGAALSHTAIVARELGIPAVVGCTNATTLLRTGDRVRVNGAQGTVEVLEAATRDAY